MILYSKLKGGNSGISILLNLGFYYIYDKIKCPTKGIFCICAKKKSPNEAPQNTLLKKIIGKFAKLEGLGKCPRPFTDHPCKKEFEAKFHEFIVIRHKLVVFKI